MAISGALGTPPASIWDYLLANILSELSVGWVLKLRDPRIQIFHDHFNRRLLNANVWTVGLDGAGAWTSPGRVGAPTEWRLRTGAVINNDSYIHADGCNENISCTPHEDEFEVIWDAGLTLSSAVTISAFWGLIYQPIADYIEPLLDCAHFFADPVVGANIQARTWNGAEEQTDTGVAIDVNAHDYRIIWEEAQVLFYIDGALVATHQVQVPDTQMMSEFLIRTEAADWRDMYLDYCRLVTL